MKLREAAQQALEALEVWQDCLTDPRAMPGWRFAVVGEKAMENLRAALAEDAMQRLTDVQQEMDCYGDGNVYHTNGMPAVEGPLSKAHRISRESRQVEPVAWVECDGELVWNNREVALGRNLYTAPPAPTWTQAHWTEYERGIVATEREACAKVCDERERANLYGVKECAAAIRARGNK